MKDFIEFTLKKTKTLYCLHGSDAIEYCESVGAYAIVPIGTKIYLPIEDIDKFKEGWSKTVYCFNVFSLAYGNNSKMEGVYSDKRFKNFKNDFYATIYDCE